MIYTEYKPTVEQGQFIKVPKKKKKPDQSFKISGVQPKVGLAPKGPFGTLYADHSDCP